MTFRSSSTTGTERLGEVEMACLAVFIQSRGESGKIEVSATLITGAEYRVSSEVEEVS